MSRFSGKGKIRLNRTFSKFFISYLAIVLISITLLSGVLYVQFSRSSLEEIQLNQRENLRQEAEHMSFIREYVFSLGLQTLRDSEVMSVIYSSEVPEIKKYTISLKIANIVTSNPIIHSIYLYNAKTGDIQYDLSRNTPLFEDPGILKALSEVDAGQTFRFIPRSVAVQKPGGGHGEEKIISVIFTDRVGQKKRSDEGSSKLPADGALVINLKSEDVLNSMNLAEEDGDSYTAVIDEDGLVVSDSNLRNFGKNRSGESYISDILSSNADWGYQVRHIDGDKAVVSYYRSESLPWTFINVSSYSMLFDKQRSLLLTIAIICGAILFVGIILSLLAARNIYLPFGKLIQTIDNQLFTRKLLGADRASSDDVRYISDAFTNVLEHADHLERSVKDSNAILKREHLKRLLSGHIEMEKDMQDREVAVIAFCLDDYSRFVQLHDRQKQNEIKTSVELIVRKLLPQRFAFEPVDFDEEMYTIIVDVEDETAYCADAQSAAADIQQNIRLTLGVSVSVMIGQCVSSLEDAYLSYSNCLELLPYRFAHGQNSVLYNDIIERKRTVDFASLDKRKKRLIEGCMLSNMEQVKRELEGIVEGMRGYPQHYILLIFNQLSLDLLKSVETGFDSDFEELEFNGIYRELNQVDTLAELQTWFITLCEKIMRLLESKRSNRKTSTVQDILDYISDNYRRSDIGIEQLAERACLSPGYFGKIFSESVGKTVNEYITDLRMQTSKRLLATTLHPIVEISASVGYNNPAYFTTIFKKHTGMTPNQYRSEHRKTNH
ncbi:helix-turn-helix domain-containing protein [Paenibacillus sp. PAMC21692]|uniref:helix-turn-helix domain-containing protein n=1 Tax=Paenibacillus sp. PAMC21692 TaxID=2762320 RepID=UPI00164D4582|nr:helix-turn-helix domain-containing protein [Paenibacillus sp. PAMC21692]QNK56565.1 AraC family transcriptional regulator [Paenibacillus sp. PAMC21692]